MFDIGWSELVLIGIVALIVIGPKELPTALRTAGMWMGKVRRMASEFQGQFQEAMREAEMAELKKQVDEIGNSTANLTNFDPLADVKSNIESAFDDKLKPPVLGDATPVATPPALPASVTSETPPITAPPALPQLELPVEVQPPPLDIPIPDSKPAETTSASPRIETAPPVRTAGERA
jgi:sec-independent protein translocase protein TatB